MTDFLAVQSFFSGQGKREGVMNHYQIRPLAAVLCCCLLGFSGGTEAAPGAERAGCPADGTVVSDRQGRTGPIIGVNNGLCVVRLADGTSRNSLAWMLTTAGKNDAAIGIAALTIGSYVCSMSAAGGMFRMSINSDSQYMDSAGKTGAYKVEGKRVSFDSGSLAGQYSEILGRGKFGLSTKFNGMFYGVCNLK